MQFTSHMGRPKINRKEKTVKKLVLGSVLLGMIAILAAGCATAPKGPTDEALISQRIQDGLKQVESKNFAAFTDFVSPSFSSSAVGNRDDLLSYLKNADSMGFLDGLKVDLSGAKTTVTGQKAAVAPVVANGSFGSITLNFEGIKEKGAWVISNVEPGY